MAYKKGLSEAQPVLLEPVNHVEVSIPEDYMGDVIGDINKKRGKVLGMESDGDMQKVVAELPQSEMFKYATDLRSMTRGIGSFTSKFARYEEVPAVEAEKIIDAAKHRIEE
jgi:elongation factor G